MKRVIAVLLLAVLAFGFTGCGSAAISSDSSSSSSTISESSSEVSKVFDPADKTLMICMGSVDYIHFRIIQLGFIEMATELGYKNVMISGLPSDQTTQTELLARWDKDIAENDVDGVMIYYPSEDSYELIQKWKSMGISVVTARLYTPDYTQQSEFIDANLAYDYAGISQTGCDYIIRTLTDREQQGAEVGFSVVMHDPSLDWKVSEDTFRARFAQTGNSFALLSSGYETYGDGNIITLEKYLNANPDMAAVYSANIDAKAWSIAQQELGRDLFVVAEFCSPENLDVLEQGGVDALLATPLYRFGTEGAKALDTVLRGTVFSKEDWNIPLGAIVVTADGTDINGIAYYREQYSRAEEYFGKENMVIPK